MNGQYQVIGTTESGERVVFGFGFTKEGAEKAAEEYRVTRPINVFTKLPYTYAVAEGGDPRAQTLPTRGVMVDILKQQLAGEYSAGDIDLNENYWDCECPTRASLDFIHPKSVDRCNKCNAERDDQPDSRANEVRQMRVVMASKPCDYCNASRGGGDVAHKPWCRNAVTGEVANAS